MVAQSRLDCVIIEYVVERGVGRIRSEDLPIPPKHSNYQQPSAIVPISIVYLHSPGPWPGTIQQMST
jgi:hypothetical protein